METATNSIVTARVIGTPFEKGASGNPNGRPKGRRSRQTVLWEALTKIATEQGMTTDEMEDLLHKSGFKQAMKGQFNFYKEIGDGLYGKMKERSEVSVEIDVVSPKVAELTQQLNDLHRTT